MRVSGNYFPATITTLRTFSHYNYETENIFSLHETENILSPNLVGHSGHAVHDGVILVVPRGWIQIGKFLGHFLGGVHDL